MTRHKFTLPVPQAPAALQELMIAGWSVETWNDEEARMIPPPALERAYGFAEFMRFAGRGELDRAWAEAEAALPPGGYIKVSGYSDQPGVYTVEAWHDGVPRADGGWITVLARIFQMPLPDALRALVARLADLAPSAVNSAHQSPSEPPPDDPEGPDRA